MRKGNDRDYGQPVIDINLPIETTDRGSRGLSVYVQDQTSSPLSLQFLTDRAFVSLAVDTIVDDIEVTLSAGHGVIAGSVLELFETGTSNFIQANVLAVNVNVITIDQPINRIYTVAGTTALKASGDMLVDGSVTPKVFSVKPLSGQSGDVVRVLFGITGTGAMDFETFGSDPILTNGCVLRIANSDGTYKNLFNFKANGGLIIQGFDYSFLQNTANNSRGFNSRVTWGGQSKHGVVIRLDGDLGEELQVVIQDNLTGGDNTNFQIQAQGHEVQP